MRLFFWWHSRLDAETLPEASCAVLRVLHKNLFCSFDLLRTGSKMGPCGRLFEEASFQWGESESSFLSSRFYFGRNASATSRKGFSILKQGTHTHSPPASPLTCRAPALLNKSNASQGNLIETLRDLWTELDRARAWLRANAASNGGVRERRAGSICQLPLPD